VLAPAAVTSAIFLLKSSGLGPTAEIESDGWSCLTWSYVVPHNAKIRTPIARSRPRCAKCRIL
jgi:hypothetical protein